MTLSSRVTIAMASVTMLTAITGGLVTHFTLDATLSPVMLDQMSVLTEQPRNAVDEIVQSTRTDIKVILGDPALRTLAESGNAAGASSDHAADVAPLTQRLESAFMAQMSAKSEYDQIRIIGVAGGGKEIVRVDRSGELGSIRALPAEELQVKGDRPYFQEAIALGRDQMYLSPVELNQEYGEIQVPHVPVLRVALPIYKKSGTPFGIVIINLDLRKAFALVRALSRDLQGTYIINRKGDYLLHPDESKTFGFEFGKSFRIQEDFPGLPDLGALTQSEALVVRHRDGRRMAVSLSPLSPLGSDSMIMVQIEPYEKLMAPLKTVERCSVVAGATSLLMALMAALFVSRSTTKPLRAVMAQLGGIRQGVAMSIVDRGPSEVALLSTTLDQMAREIVLRTEALENEIEQRKKTEDALNEYVEKVRLFSAVVESSEDAILSKTLDGIITSWNPAAERLYGYTRDEAIGKSVDTVIPPEKNDEHIRLMARIAAGERIPPVDTGRLHKDGHTIDVALTLSPIKSDAGHIIGASSIARDISRRLRAEERFRLVVEASPNGIVMVDKGGVIQLVNRETEQMFDYGRDELLGQPIEMLIPHRYREHHPGMRESFIADPMGRAMGKGRDLYGLRKDHTEFPIEVGLNSVKTGGELMVLGVIVDITERKRAETEIQRYTNELKRSNQELETFAYAASHDLQEPLRMVASYVELLAKRYEGKLDEKADKYIYYAVDGATRMKQLINDMLVYSRVSTQGKALEPTDASAVLAQVLHGLEHLTRDTGAAITWGELPMVMADPIQLGQLLQNLISNAIKFNGTDRPEVHIEAVASNEHWEFTVRDHGIGIDPKFAERVFQMFQRLNTRENYSGNGIGLALAKKIVERHGGHIWFTPAEGQGTIFHFTICGI